MKNNFLYKIDVQDSFSKIRTFHTILLIFLSRYTHSANTTNENKIVESAF